MKRTIAVFDNDLKQIVESRTTSIPEQVAAILLELALDYGGQSNRFDMIVTTTNDVLHPQTNAFRITGVGKWEILEKKIEVVKA